MGALQRCRSLAASLPCVAPVQVLPRWPILRLKQLLTIGNGWKPGSGTGTRRQPGRASLQRISNPHQSQAPPAFSAAGCRHGSRPAGQQAPQAARAPRRGARRSPSAGVTTTSRDPKTNSWWSPSNSRPLPKLKKKSPSVCPGFIAVVGVLLSGVAAVLGVVLGGSL